VLKAHCAAAGFSHNYALWPDFHDRGPMADVAVARSGADKLTLTKDRNGSTGDVQGCWGSEMRLPANTCRWWY
jgi:hypothetical protein